MRWVLLLLLTGCDDRGREGAACFFEGTVFRPAYRCDPGLVCNTAREPKVCERLNAGGVDAPCELEQHCRVDLWCPGGQDAGCAPRRKVGEPCPSGLGCEVSLRCDKTEDAGIICVQP